MGIVLPDDLPGEAKAPDFIEPIVGYKVLVLDRFNNRLFTPFITQVVCKGRTEAICGQRATLGSQIPYHTSPKKECSCGLYSYHSIHKCINSANSRALLAGDSYTIILCTVINTGIIEVHSQGMRSQFQELVALSSYKYGLSRYAVDPLDPLTPFVCPGPGPSDIAVFNKMMDRVIRHYDVDYYSCVNEMVENQRKYGIALDKQMVKDLLDRECG